MGFMSEFHGFQDFFMVFEVKPTNFRGFSGVLGFHGFHEFSTTPSKSVDLQVWLFSVSYQTLKTSL